MWDIKPRTDLIRTDSANVAYLSAREGEAYVIYFTGNGKISVDLGSNMGFYELVWIPVESAEWGRPGILEGTGWTEVQTEMTGNCFAVLTKK
jgi:hypothetical protein